MLEPILGSKNAERVLIFILAREQGYATGISQFFETDLFGIQKQLDKFEAGGILASQLAGKTRMYSFNPRYPFLPELKELLNKALTFYSPDERERFTMDRRRPRRKGKPNEAD